MRRSIPVSQALPRSLAFSEHGKIGVGYDVATTDKGKSNPSSISVIEKVGLDFWTRLIVRWKTRDPEVARAVISAVLDLLPRRPAALAIDATNEKYFAADLKTKFQDRCEVLLVVSSEGTEFLGEAMSFKAYLGNLLLNAFEEGQLHLPNEPFVSKDFRLVKRSRGSFETDTDENGNHGDTFDSTKLALHALSSSGGPVEAVGTRVGSSMGRIAGSVGRVLRNPFAAKFEKGDRSLC